MKRPLFKILSIILCTQLIIISGCKKKENNINTVSSYLKNLTSYSTEAEIKVYNNKENYTYKTNQYYSKGNGSRLEIGKDRVYIYLDDNIYVKDLINEYSYFTKKNTDGIFRLSLIEEYIALLYTNENIKYSYKNIKGQKYQLIELYIPGNNRNISKAILYVNIKNKLPNKICILDSRNQEKVEVVYKDFKPSIQVNKDLFNIKDIQ